MKSVASSRTGRGNKEVLRTFRGLLANSALFVTYVQDLCGHYVALVDCSVAALATKTASAAKKRMANESLLVQFQWHEYIQGKRREGVREWTAFGAFDEKYRGSLAEARVVGLGLGALSTVIDEEVPKELKLALAPPLFNTELPSQVKPTPEELPTLYYSAGAILHRAKRHYTRLLKTDGSKAAEAYAFLEYNAIHKKQAEAEGLPVELVRARRLLHLVRLLEGA